MEIQDMRIFTVVARLESISKTAEHLNYVQSHISKRIMKLEEELGCKLLIRSNKGITLSQKGETFLSYCHRVLYITDEMEEEFEIVKPIITIGMSQVVSKTYAHSLYIDPKYKVYVQSIKDLISIYNQSLLDILISNQELPCDGLQQIYHEKLAWAGGIEDQQPILQNPVVVSRSRDCPYRKATNKYLREHASLETQHIIEVDTLDALLSVLESGEANAILPIRLIRENSHLAIKDDYQLPDVNIYVYSHSKSLCNDEINNLFIL